MTTTMLELPPTDGCEFGDHTKLNVLKRPVCTVPPTNSANTKSPENNTGIKPVLAGMDFDPDTVIPSLAKQTVTSTSRATYKASRTIVTSEWPSREGLFYRTVYDLCRERLENDPHLTKLERETLIEIGTAALDHW